MKLLSFLVAAVFVLCALPAQWQEPAKSVELKHMPAVLASTLNADLEVLALHEAGLESLSTIAEDGTFVVAFAGTGGIATKFATQGPMGTEPVPMLRATWCDKDGVTHEVVTPIVSQTDAGLARAVALHDKLVALQQAKHPPKPCPKP